MVHLTEPENGHSPEFELAQKDRDTFTGLYRENVSSVFRFCYHRLNSREAAEDATSEVFIKAWANWNLLQNKSSFRGWLFSIARNVVADAYRTRKPAGVLNGIPEVVDLSPTPEEQALVAAAVREVHNALSELTPGQRDIVEFRLAGLTGTEIADALGRSPGSVKIAQSRAYHRLRGLLKAPTSEMTTRGSRS